MPLSCKMNVLQDVVGNMCLMYAVVTSSAVFNFRGTVIKYDVSKHMKVNAYLLPLDFVGNSPMVSTAQPANGTWLTFRCIGPVLTLFGRELHT